MVIRFDALHCPLDILSYAHFPFHTMSLLSMRAASLAHVHAYTLC
jgi:hypothetical protein